MGEVVSLASRKRGDGSALKIKPIVGDITSDFHFHERSTPESDYHGGVYSLTGMNTSHSKFIGVTSTNRGHQITLMNDGRDVDIQLDHGDMMDLWGRLTHQLRELGIIPRG